MTQGTQMRGSSGGNRRMETSQLIKSLVKIKDLELLSHRKQVCFALFCAKQVSHLVKDEQHKEINDNAIKGIFISALVGGIV